MIDKRLADLEAVNFVELRYLVDTVS